MIGKLPFEIDKVKAELCKRKLSNFVKEFWDTVVPNDLVWAPHMDVICSEVQEVYQRVFRREKKEHDLIINVPPGTSKTKLASVFATAWAFANMPSIKSYVGSYSDTAAQGIADDITLCMRSELYRKYYPEVDVRKDKNAPSNFKTSKNGEFYAFTVGGSLTSKHADILTVDDPLDPRRSVSKAHLESTIFFFDKTLPTRKVDKEVTPTVTIMQRLSTQDPTGHLLSKKGETIRHVCLPGELSDHVKPEKYRGIYVNGLLDPVRLSSNVLKGFKRDLGEDGYAGQIMQTPVKEGGLIWQKWFREIDDSIFPRVSSMSLVDTDWDLAFTDDDTNAASAYVSSGIIDNGLYIFDIDFKYLEFPELIKWMKEVTGPHFIEAKASGKSAKQTLVRNGIVAIEVKVPGGNDKINRAKQASAVPQAGMVYIKKSLADRLYNDSQQGILNFPKNPKKDVADALAQCLLRKASKGRIVSTTGGKSVLDSIGL
ncbi:MAG TPA: hypothetical protein PLU07_08665 [Ferruginibacter sp.]|nr:hypothetical protein [Ferruginibacter sp.]